MVKRQRTIPMPSAAKFARLITAPKAALAQAQLAKLKKDVRRLKGAIETKTYSKATSITPTTTPQVLASGAQVWEIVQGVTATNRIGDKIVVTRIRYELFLTATVGQEVSLALVQDKQCGGAVVAPTQVFGDSNGVLGANAAFHLGLRNDEYLDRYKVLSVRHQVFDLGTGFNKRVVMEWKGRMEIRHGATGGAITDLTGSNFQLIYASQGSTVTCSGPCNMHIEYEDE